MIPSVAEISPELAGASARIFGGDNEFVRSSTMKVVMPTSVAAALALSGSPPWRSTTRDTSGS